MFSVTGELETQEEVQRLRMELSMAHQEIDNLNKMLNNFDHKNMPKQKPKTPPVPQNDIRAKKEFDKLQQKSPAQQNVKYLY